MGEINQVNIKNWTYPLHLIIAHTNGYTEEKGVNKYLVFDSKDENKDLLKNMFLLRLEIKSKK